jgi:zinc protease
VEQTTTPTHLHRIVLMTRIVSPRALSAAVIAALALGASPPLAAQHAASAAGAPSISIPFQKYSLGNGLTVVLAPDHTTPTVAVAVVYHVGSKNEVPGHTGFAHMFEHVMFTGSGHVPYGMHDKYTEGVGGGNNGQTYFDWTRYYETDPSNYLETILWLESDRMGFLLDSLDEAKFKAQREIVKNERRQSYDNQPYGRETELLGMAMYPKNNPYSWPTIGAMADLTDATVEDVKRFFRLYYAPNNATLNIAGDFDPAQAKAWVAKYFSALPRGAAITRPIVGPPAITAEKRLTFEDRVQIPRLRIRWPGVSVHSADQYALDLMARILAGSRTARITKAMVYDAQSAASVNAFSGNNENEGTIDLIATPRPGHTLTELETQVDSVIARFKSEGPTADELQRAKAGQELSFVDGLQSNLGKALQLGQDQTFFNDPSHSFTVDYPKTQAVTAADVRRVASKYLGAARIVLSTVPLGKTDLAAHADKSTAITDPLTEKATSAGEAKQ